MRIYNEDNVNILDFIIWIALAFLYASFTIFNISEISTIGVLVTALIIAILYSYKTNEIVSIPIERLQIHMILFALFCFASMIWARSASDAFNTGITILEILVCVEIIYAYAIDKKDIEPLLTATVLGGYIIAVYFLFVYGGLQVALSNASNGIREGVEFANVNAIGRNMAWTISINLFIIFKNRKLQIWSVGIILPIIALAVCQSRTSLLAAIMGVLLIVFFYSGRTKGIIFRFIVTIVALIILYYAVSRISIFGGVVDRLDGLRSLFVGGDTDSSALSRQRMIELGIQLFKEHPIVGVGIGNPHIYNAESSIGMNAYLHNNYAEMIAGGGFIGTFLYYIMHLHCLYLLIKKWRFGNLFTAVCVVILLMFFLVDYGAVTYYYKETYWFMVICYLQVRNMEREECLVYENE